MKGKLKKGPHRKAMASLAMLVAWDERMLAFFEIIAKIKEEVAL